MQEGTAVAGTLVVGVGVLVVVITCGFLVRQRDRLDTQEDLKEWVALILWKKFCQNI